MRTSSPFVHAWQPNGIAAGIGQQGAVLGFGAGIAFQVLGAVELGGVDEDGHDRLAAAPHAFADQGQMALVEGPHRRHKTALERVLRSWGSGAREAWIKVFASGENSIREGLCVKELTQI
jgi:hypothetical protein